MELHHSCTTIFVIFTCSALGACINCTRSCANLAHLLLPSLSKQTDCQITGRAWIFTVDIRQEFSSILLSTFEGRAMGNQIELLQGTLDLLILKTLALEP